MQHLREGLLAFCIGLTLCVSGESAAAQPRGLRGAIEKGNQQFLAALSRGDGAGMAALYTANGQLFPTNSEIVSGKQAIKQFWQGVVNSGIKGGALRTLEVGGEGDMAYEVGKYTLTGEGGKVLDTGKYVVIWKRELGKWKLHRDIWNTTMPASGK